MTTEERVRACMAKNPDWPDRRRAKALKLTVAEVQAVTGGVAAPASPAPKGRTLEQFRAEFDVRERIRGGLKALGKGTYQTDQEFREACGVQTQYWRRFADLDEFKPYRWRHREVLYWAQPATLAAMKDIVGVV